MSPPPPPAAPIFVLMGVSGSGKTTIGHLLAARSGLLFADADDFHPQSNKEKMAAGHPLTDDDRRPWLETLHELLRSWLEKGTGGILACSALKASYRTLLARDLPREGLHWILLDLPRTTLEARLRARNHPFMNPALLDSQLQTLELPHEPNARTVRNDREPDLVVDEILAGSGAKDSHGTPAV